MANTTQTKEQAEPKESEREQLANHLAHLIVQAHRLGQSTSQAVESELPDPSS